MSLNDLINNNFLDIKIDDLNIHLKMEGYNPAGSIKIKTAYALIEHYEKLGLINENTKLIESSSGNLGVALSSVCAEKKYNFTCVCDRK
ncbi:pyridoxal-phosphate dependent enzyme [Vibrio sp. PP-XX7]